MPLPPVSHKHYVRFSEPVKPVPGDGPGQRRGPALPPHKAQQVQ